MYVSLAEWRHLVRTALADKETNLNAVAEKIGISYSYLTALASGRVVKGNYLDIAKKVNEILDIDVLPEKPELPCDEWCGEVRRKLFVRRMSINQLSSAIGYSRDRVSLVINGHALDYPVIDKINEALEIEDPVCSCE